MKLRTHVGVIAALFLFCAPFARAQGKPDASSEVKNSLRQFLRTFDNDKATRYIAALADLNDDGTPEAIVYLIGPKWCGSGGCNMLVLKQDGGVWKIVTKLTIVEPPVRMLKNISNGWHSIAIFVRGGGVQHGYEAELRFDGKTYPRNPSVPPARRLRGNAAGETIITSSQDGTPLYDDHEVR